MLETVYVIIPSLNPDEKLAATISGLKNAGFINFIVVNDGSDSRHLKFFPDEGYGITVLHHKRNRGKGAALKTAFRYIRRNCPDASIAITVDGDGQHTPEDAINCVKALEGKKKTVVLGCRDFGAKNVPPRSRFGNRMTSFIFRLVCGMKISDTQTGLRAYPTTLLPLLLNIKGDRFEYETNMLLKFKQSGVKLREVKIRTVYIEENASSHFHPIKDSIRVYGFIVRYLISSGISFVVDIGLFYLFCLIFKSMFGALAEIISTVIARFFSSLVNYNINRKQVFDFRKKGDHALLRYYTLAIPQMLASAAFVSLFSQIFNTSAAGDTFIKVIVDIILFFISYRIQQDWVFATKKKREADVKEKMTAGKVAKRSLIVFGTAIGMIIVTVFSACFMICYGPSPSLRDMLVISAKQASATKWAPSLFLSKSAINEIMENSTKINTDVVDVDEYYEEAEAGEWDDAVDGMKLIFLKKPKFKAYLLLIKDPKRVTVGVSSSNFSSATEGMRIFDMVSKYSAVAAINGGEFADPGGVGVGNRPMGLTYSEGKCVWNDGLSRTFMGFTKDNKFICKESMSKAEAERLGMRDAVSFQNGNSLIEEVGGEVKLYYADDNTGTSQRTAIGQRKDGTVIFLVTDGRTADSIGATRNDVIDIMVSYGATNAGMLDGGSSAMLYYRNYYDVYPSFVKKSQLDEYQLMGLVNRYKAFTKPRRIPTYFIVR